ncbi:MAG: hypothetical protein G01um101430_219 [Parcubacteria group bacterium Gr01-1014_30]|nr:MAG: hypothetical protein G01um101430_219 [Parcubacteria group bacterium Gr01-1014_30]
MKGIGQALDKRSGFVKIKHTAWIRHEILQIKKEAAKAIRIFGVEKPLLEAVFC